MRKIIATWLGNILIEESCSHIVRLDFVNCPADAIEQNNDSSHILQLAAEQLQEYLCGKRRIFDLPIALHGTQFQIRVWNELLKIPYGVTVSYKYIACQIGNPRAARAVGTANHNNPIPIIVPCHRVVAANGGLGGYSGGVEIKRKLLALERYSRLVNQAEKS